MKCERCGKEMWVCNTIKIPTDETSVGWYKVCPECHDQWEHTLKQTFHQYMKEGEQK